MHTHNSEPPMSPVLHTHTPLHHLCINRSLCLNWKHFCPEVSLCHISAAAAPGEPSSSTSVLPLLHLGVYETKKKSLTGTAGRWKNKCLANKSSDTHTRTLQSSRSNACCCAAIQSRRDRCDNVTAKGGKICICARVRNQECIQM